jgi:quercetin dioxygenase-like cupin family protein
MEAKPYIKYPKPYQPGGDAEVSGTPLIDEPRQVSFGINDFKPGIFRPLHGHHTFELILVDSSSEGPGYIHFDGRWWRVDPGAAVFVPKGSVHSWSSGNTKGFRMLWIYGGARAEAGRIWHEKPEEGKGISPEEEKNAPVWTPKAAGG